MPSSLQLFQLLEVFSSLKHENILTCTYSVHWQQFVITNKYKRYYWTRKAPACLLTLLCHYGKPRRRLCINIHHYTPPIGCKVTHRAATSLTAAGPCGVSEGPMSKHETNFASYSFIRNQFENLRRQICREYEHICVRSFVVLHCILRKPWRFLENWFQEEEQQQPQ